MGILFLFCTKTNKAIWNGSGSCYLIFIFYHLETLEAFDSSESYDVPSPFGKTFHEYFEKAGVKVKLGPLLLDKSEETTLT